MAQDGTEIVYNSLLELELIEAGYQVALRERYGKRWRQARPDGRARRRAARLAHGAVAAWGEVVDAMPTTTFEPSEVAGLVPGLMQRCGLASYDAVHAATALNVGVPLVTLDTQFARVAAADLSIHTIGSKVARMRAIRRTG